MFLIKLHGSISVNQRGGEQETYRAYCVVCCNKFHIDFDGVEV